ncbi:MAG TPA: hypothetical protein VNJ02_10995 [Vicinamibacterales bacterium]|nr:hypothetical protein [Vicinamibacterales bacterium]
MTITDPLAVAGLVIAELEALGARYSIGGSMASAYAGEPRSTLDVDIVCDLSAAQARLLAMRLQREFYVDGLALERAVDNRTSANLIHIDSSVKIDLFIAGGTPLDEQLLQRRMAVVSGSPPRELFVHTPEDILLQKLRWFRLGGEVSDRQWRDIRGIVDTQGARLDRLYLHEGAAILGVVDLLQRAVPDAGSGGPSKN